MSEPGDGSDRIILRLERNRPGCRLEKLLQARTLALQSNETHAYSLSHRGTKTDHPNTD